MMGQRADRSLIYPLINQIEKEQKKIAFFEGLIKT
jgi:hypothetical protein